MPVDLHWPSKSPGFRVSFQEPNSIMVDCPARVQFGEVIELQKTQLLSLTCQRICPQFPRGRTLVRGEFYRRRYRFIIIYESFMAALSHPGCASTYKVRCSAKEITKAVSRPIRRKTMHRFDRTKMPHLYAAFNHAHTRPANARTAGLSIVQQGGQLA